MKNLITATDNRIIVNSINIIGYTYCLSIISEYLSIISGMSVVNNVPNMENYLLII